MELDACLAWLKAHQKDAPALRGLSDRSGVSFHTIRKIATGETKDPGINTMRKVAESLAELVTADHPAPTSEAA